MLSLSCHIVLIVLLVIVFMQDWKYRAVNWVVFPLLFLVCLIPFVSEGYSFKTLVFNLFFLMTVFALLTSYVSIKRNKWTNIFKADLGIGDLLFLVAIIPLFMDRNFILFFITGMMISVLIHLFITNSKSKTTIPLAGYLSLYLIALSVTNLLVPFNLFFTPVL